MPQPQLQRKDLFTNLPRHRLGISAAMQCAKLPRPSLQGDYFLTCNPQSIKVTLACKEIQKTLEAACGTRKIWIRTRIRNTGTPLRWHPVVIDQNESKRFHRFDGNRYRCRAPGVRLASRPAACAGGSGYCGRSRGARSHGPLRTNYALSTIEWRKAPPRFVSSSIKEDEKGSTSKEVVQTRDGSVARLVAINGKPLTAEQEQPEADRLQRLLDQPDLQHVGESAKKTTRSARKKSST